MDGTQAQQYLSTIEANPYNEGYEHGKEVGAAQATQALKLVFEVQDEILRKQHAILRDLSNEILEIRNTLKGLVHDFS